ncbi:MAG: hypothetical protein HF300_10095 [Ignavibacteria bacterium]|jgi:tRNA C32,U32 (ribose-2'-O)-methylase TrmJ|nr:hypothetical protein [Ignavibacteria bacterium]MCU7499661.1 hypothetical protein [Ignavibacteria bacterium]MCU7512898.1 hypothetical protein [Ignavibacteria bacterium]MCU7521424.1 hypothetical protein [Ignavibacteria bacterium]MCU7526397.1 hypothetical protein [Ignavibacteria bacterium]
MKKGCFVTAIIILTILLGSGIYIFRNHKGVLLRWAKPFVVSKVQKETEKKIALIKDDQYKDTLRSIINEYVEVVENNDNYDINKGKDFMDELQSILHRKQIDSTDIRQLTEFLNKEKLTYERSEKNGN